MLIVKLLFWTIPFGRRLLSDSKSLREQFACSEDSKKACSQSSGYDLGQTFFFLKRSNVGSSVKLASPCDQT